MRNRILVGTMLLAILGLFTVAGAEKKEAAAVGSPAPSFALSDQNGKQVSLADLRGKIVVLEWWNEGCPYVQRHARAGTMKELAARYKDREVVWLAINSTAGSSDDSNRKAVEKFALSYPILNDASGTIGKAYGAKTTPHMFVIDKSGTLAYAGAIDDDPEDQKSSDVNYIAQALDQLLAGQTVSMAETKSYGCAIRYAN